MAHSPLHVVGETCLSFNRKGQEFNFEGLIVKNLDADVLLGTPFIDTNYIAVRPAKHQVIDGDESIHSYGSQHPTTVSSSTHHAIVLRSPPTSTPVWPGEFIGVELPSDTPPESGYALEPRTDAPSIRKLTAFQLWPIPGIVSSVAGKIRCSSSNGMNTPARYTLSTHQKPKTKTHNHPLGHHPSHLYLGLA